MITAKLKLSSLRGLAAAVGLALAGASAGAAPVVLAYTDGQNPQSYLNLQAYYASLTAVGLGSAYALQANGTIDSSAVTTTTTNIAAFAKSKGLAVYPTVSDYNNAYNNGAGGFDPNVSNTVLASAASRANAVTNLVNLVTANGTSTWRPCSPP